jgi:heme O synthase-like polyprenyltransferase
VWGLPLFAGQIRGDCLSEGFGTSELLKASMSLTVEGFTIQLACVYLVALTPLFFFMGYLIVYTIWVPLY